LLPGVLLLSPWHCPTTDAFFHEHCVAEHRDCKGRWMALRCNASESSVETFIHVSRVILWVSESLHTFLRGLVDKQTKSNLLCNEKVHGSSISRGRAGLGPIITTKMLLSTETPPQKHRPQSRAGVAGNPDGNQWKATKNHETPQKLKGLAPT
jgi:hypothetical protein